MELRTFVVVYEPDADGWHASIPEVRGSRSGGATLAEARQGIREALATCVDAFEDADAVARDAVLEDGA